MSWVVEPTTVQLDPSLLCLPTLFLTACVYMCRSYFCFVFTASDSSRYFVLRIEDGKGNHAFIGLGFQVRGDAFDFKNALQEHTACV